MTLRDRGSIGAVIPSFNSGEFLREAIDSVLAQDCPALSCLVVDGGSTDGSVDLLESYGNAITYISESDNGQADAIQKGVERLDCDLVGWLNADDRLLPGSIEAVRDAAAADEHAVLFHGDIERVDRWGRLTGVTRSVDIDYEKMRSGRGRVVQPGSFVRRAPWVAAGGLRQEFHLLMDVDLWIRLLALGRAHRLNRRLAQFRVHAAAKSSQPPYRYYLESLRISSRHESDHRARALMRRAWNMARHFAVWNLGRIFRAHEPPPRSVPWVRVRKGQPTPSALAALAARGDILLADTVAPGERPDVEVCLDSAEHVPVGRTRRDVVVCDDASPRRLVQRIEAGAVGPAFVLADATARAVLERAGYPACRIGAAEKNGTWRHAIAVVTGSSPAGMVN